MGMVLDILWWIIKHWAEIVAAILVLDKIVTMTPNPYDDLLVTGAKWVIGKVKAVKQRIVNAFVSSVTKKNKNE